MASKFDEFFSSGVSRVTGKQPAPPPVYTGAYERVTVQAENQFHLRAFMHKGKLVAIAYGDRVLPFVVEQVEGDQIVQLQNVYRKGLAGLIDRLTLRVVKG